MIASILFPPYLFGVVFLCITGLGLREFYSLTDHLEQAKTDKIFSVISGCVLFLSFYLYLFHAFCVQIFTIYALCVIALFLSELFRKKENPIQNIALSLMGHIYVVLPFCFMSLIESKHQLFLLAFFLIIWASDTGAYLVGICIGKHKMFERISPKKTWEGFFGGMLFALLTAFIFNKLTTTEAAGSGNLLELWQWMLFALAVFVFGTLGDLVESMFKRSLNVKDSGSFMPGHGGILDRFDSALVAAPVAFLLLSFC